jgi:hypothetical protein
MAGGKDKPPLSAIQNKNMGLTDPRPNPIEISAIGFLKKILNFV